MHSNWPPRRLIKRRPGACCSVFISLLTLKEIRWQDCTGSFEQKIAIVARNTFRDPTGAAYELHVCSRMAKDFRTDTLHVPKMKIFVATVPELPVRRLAHEVVFTDGDTCGVEMLDRCFRLAPEL